MAYGAYTYNKLQLGREGTAGTAVAATTIWRGPFGDIEDDRQRQTAEEQIGLIVSAERLYDARLGARLSMPATELTFEQLPHILEAGIKTATPTGTAAYTRVYSLPVNETLNTIKTYTIEAGNVAAPGDIREMEYSFVESFVLSGQGGEAWKKQANWTGRQVAESAFTPALSLPAVEESLFANTSVYIDASGGTIGSTQKAGVLMAANINVVTGLVPRFTANGTLYFAAHAQRKPQITFTLTLELESGNLAKTERDAFEAASIRLIRLANTGTGSKAWTMDMAARYSKVNPYQNSDENTTVQLEGRAVYSSADALIWSLSVVNTIANM
jgi:hypothetical protein